MGVLSGRMMLEWNFGRAGNLRIYWPVFENIKRRKVEVVNR